MGKIIDGAGIVLSTSIITVNATLGLVGSASTEIIGAMIVGGVAFAELVFLNVAKNLSKVQKEVARDTAFGALALSAMITSLTVNKQWHEPQSYGIQQKADVKQAAQSKTVYDAKPMQDVNADFAVMRTIKAIQKRETQKENFRDFVAAKNPQEARTGFRPIARV